jgi:hypothetical protein
MAAGGERNERHPQATLAAGRAQRRAARRERERERERERRLGLARRVLFVAPVVSLLPQRLAQVAHAGVSDSAMTSFCRGVLRGQIDQCAAVMSSRSDG